MVLIWKGLDHALHQVLLSHRVFADDYDFKDLGQNHCLVDFEGDPVQVAQSENVFAYRHA